MLWFAVFWLTITLTGSLITGLICQTWNTCKYVHFAVKLRYTVKTLKETTNHNLLLLLLLVVEFLMLVWFFSLPHYNVPEIHVYVVFGYENDGMIMSLKQCKIKFKARIKLNHNIHVYINLVIAVSKFHSKGKSQQQMKEMTVCSITVNIYLFLFVTEV